MKEENIKFAFSKVKQDIDSLKLELTEIKELLRVLQDDLNTQKLHNLAQNNQINTSTHRQITSTHPATSTDTSTVPSEIEGLNSPNLPISTGNQGVSTDRQTDRQTDENTQNNIEQNISEASELLDSLDELKGDISKKFKRITPQEMAVFSSIYQLEEENPDLTTYKEIAKRLKLSQSSIRDYVQRMINKGISIKKNKINNKKILLSISSSLRKIAPLSTIIQLRGL